MSLVVPNVAEPVLLNYMLKTTSFPDYVLKLYSNSYTPDATSTLPSFTEATFSGYTIRTFGRTDWASATQNVSGKGESSAPMISWTAASSQTVYGYYVQSDTNDLLWAEVFDTSKALQANDILNITLNFTLASAN